MKSVKSEQRAFERTFRRGVMMRGSVKRRRNVGWELDRSGFKF